MALLPFAHDCFVGRISGYEEGGFDVVFFENVEEAEGFAAWAVIEGEVNDFVCWLGERFVDDLDEAGGSGLVAGGVGGGVGNGVFADGVWIDWVIDGNGDGVVAVVGGGGTKVVVRQAVACLDGIFAVEFDDWRLGIFVGNVE